MPSFVQATLTSGAGHWTLENRQRDPSFALKSGIRMFYREGHGSFVEADVCAVLLAMFTLPRQAYRPAISARTWMDQRTLKLVHLGTGPAAFVLLHTDLQAGGLS